MDGLTLITHFLLTSVAAGVAGTVAMTFAMQGMARVASLNADMVRAIGGMFTRTDDRSSWIVGAFVHLIWGIIFAMVYIMVTRFFDLHYGFPLFFGCFVLGHAHGFVVSFLLMATVAEHHPVERFQKAGIGVAIIHFLGHVVYGSVVGLVLLAAQLNIP